MSLCWLMQSDFLFGTGRMEEVLRRPMYNENDLHYGIVFASDYIAAGETLEPLHKWDLAAFRTWCEAKLLDLEREKSLTPGR